MPARAPPSIDMLQTVMRPSIDSARMASPAYSMTEPVPPAVPISPMMARMMSLASTPGGSYAVDVDQHVLGLLLDQRLRGEHVLDLEVPMPCASAPKAPCVEVWLSPQTMVVPGSVKPCSGPTTWTMPWRLSSSLKYSTPKSRGVLGQRLDLDAAFLVVDAVRAVGRRHVVVDDGERLLGRADLAAGHAQAFEGLRARHLVDEMAVDVEQAGAVGLPVDDVVVEDLVVQGLGCGVGHGALRSLPRCEVVAA